MLQVKLEKPTAENSRELLLSNGMIVLLDFPLPAFVLDYIWRAVLWNFRWYAYSTLKNDGSKCRVAMHRLIANTPPGEVCHHYNKHSLDNRSANLLNQTPIAHQALHGIRRWGRKKPDKTSTQRQ